MSFVNKFSFAVGYTIDSDGLRCAANSVSRLRRWRYPHLLVRWGKWANTQMGWTPFQRSERWALNLCRLLEKLWKGFILNNGYVLHITAVEPVIRGYLSTPNGAVPKGAVP